MKDLDDSGLRLLAYLVAHLPKAKPHDPRTFVGYKDAHDALGLSLLGSSYGVSLKSQGLNSLADWTVDHGLPGITGLIIDREKLYPGEGYFKLFGFDEDPFNKWANEIARAKAFDWSSYLNPVATKPKPVICVEHQDTKRTSAIWRLIAHHEHPKESLEWMEIHNVIAIGWSETGDLSDLVPEDSADIGRRIRDVYPDLENSAQGGPSLWNLYHEMQIGDLVIVAANGTRRVMEVVGDYFFADQNSQLIGYQHQRAAMLTAMDADELWDDVGRDVEKGQNQRWTLAKCRSSADAQRSAYMEGGRFEVRSTAVERNPKARLDCIAHYGPRCFACGFDFTITYGELGKDFIHVHHRKDIALSNGVYVIDPIEHLIPLCPNCHAMVHRTRPSMSVEALQELIRLRQQVTR
ncbi:hypothetical protein P3W24_15095 [Luteibacter sp. PPL201]|uniref:HNH domain-containing protein n=1 Tax=Luteibacter sahnii TaxID=3021977 RepID=A0ABT6BE00_9GAMM|nr:hypothetical protein [Luteibacter sp. PPL193]MDY1548877.1 hypothetical protein [Luteibacter sp. PPL193]